MTPSLISLNDDVRVDVHSYRTAYVKDIMFVMDRTYEGVQEFERELADAAHVRPDNHVSYVLVRGGERLCLQFTDDHVYVGNVLGFGDR